MHLPKTTTGERVEEINIPRSSCLPIPDSPPIGQPQLEARGHGSPNDLVYRGQYPSVQRWAVNGSDKKKEWKQQALFG